MLSPAFSFKLGQQVHQGLVVVGKFDGKIPSLACATTGGKILLHSPHEGSQYSDSQLPAVRLLNINRKITALAAGPLATRNPASSSSSFDLLLAGTQSNLLAYDVDRNADIFFRDVQDGVNCISIGKLSSMTQPLVITGGNCSILGFDNEGNEAFWTVTSDNVSAMTLCDIDGDGLQELLVGSEDFEVRSFRGEELIGETTEADKILHLAPVAGQSRFAYGLVNGTVGVYNGMKSRMWRVKTKHRPTSILAYDLNADGVSEVISGWVNGGFNVRSGESGEVLFRGTLSAPIAAVVRADYRMDGKDSLMVCSEAGEIKGFLPADAEALATVELGTEQPQSEDDKVLAAMQQQKAELTAELRLVEANLKAASKPVGEVIPGALPPGTVVAFSVEPNPESGYLSIRVSVNTEVQIVNVLAMDLEGAILDGFEVLTVSPLTPSNQAILPLRPSKNQPCVLKIQTHLVVRSSGHQLHVMESTLTLPKFANFKMVASSSNTPTPGSQVTIYINFTTQRLLEWISSVFIIPTPIKTSGDKLKAYFVSCSIPVRRPENFQPQPIHIHATTTSDQSTGKSILAVRFRCNNMELAAELVQDLAKFLGLSDLESEADFPEDLALFEEVLQRVADYNASRVRLAADMADDSQRVKALVIRAEDSRLMCDMESMRRAYTELFTINSQLIGGYNIRASNHEGLLAALKEVNLMIQRAANLRVGKPKATVIVDCRAAVKSNNLASLFRIIRQGHDRGGLSK